MNIILLTSFMEENYFNKYTLEAKIKPNPSNQNFYFKLLECLKINHKVTVISLRPFVKGMFDETSLEEKIEVKDNVTYLYPKVSANKLYKAFKETKYVYTFVKNYISKQKMRDFVMIVDPLRIPLEKTAILLRKRYGKKVIAILSDNPENLSNVKHRYIKTFKKYIPLFDGYISLTERLNDLFNIHRRPSYLLEGIALNFNQKEKGVLNNYLFFGGALYERYGIKNMLEAYRELGIPYKMVIAGDGELKSYIYYYTENIDTRVLYLSQIDRQTIQKFEAHASLNINPRPYNEKLDKESIPSKMIEYLSSGALVMSTPNSRLQELFLDEVLWLKGDTKDDIIDGLIAFSKLSENKKKEMSSAAKEKVLKLFGVETQSKALDTFLKKIKK